MLVIRNYYGVPSPTVGPALSIQTGDVIELICADIHSPWWQVSALTSNLFPFFVLVVVFLKEKKRDRLGPGEGLAAGSKFTS